MSCPDRDTLLRRLLGDLSENDSAIVDGHLAGCVRCHLERDEVVRLMGLVRGGPPVKEPDDAFCAGVMERVSTHSPNVPETTTRWAWLAAAAALVLVAGTAGFALRGRTGGEGEFVARGGGVAREAKSDAEVVALRGTELRAVHGVILGPADKLAVRYANASSEPVYFMALALDSAGEIHWLFPAWIDESSNPEAIRVPAQTPSRLTTELVAPDRPAAGPLRVISIVSDRVVHVKQVEAALAGRSSREPVAGRLPGLRVRESLSYWEQQ